MCSSDYELGAPVVGEIRTLTELISNVYVFMCACMHAGR